MKTTAIIFSVVLTLLSVTSCKTEVKVEPVQKHDISEFLGQWTIDIQGGSVGWLEVRQEEGYLDGEILWGGGSVLPVSGMVFVKDQVLIVQRSNNVVRTRDESKNAVKTQVVTTWLEIAKNGEKIDGVLLTPKRNGIGVDSTLFTGTKLPAPPPAPDLAAVKVHKQRFGYMVNNTICEFGEVLINGASVYTINSESTEVEDIKKTIKDIGLEGVENINYLQAIKRVIGMINKPLAN